MENNHSSLTPIWNNNYPQSLIMPNYFNTCSNSSMDQTDLFESTLSSIVSSPVASNPEANGDMMIRELIGRLGTISNSTNNINNNNSTYNSTSSTPVNNYPSVPTDQFNMLPFGADPGFVERAARLSSLGNHDAQLAQFSLNNEADLVASRSQLGGSSGGVQVSMNAKKKKKKAIRLSRASTPENGKLGDSREGSSVSEQIPAGDLRANARKRKAVPKGKGKDAPSVKNGKGVIEEQGNCKRSKTEEASGNEKEATQKSNKGSNGGSKSGSKENSEVVEAPKDYIHLRARRGQATDSHSLAERVRREKISERMKFLQDLVPGCNKVTGKAVMLDEIINYVQSLQRQVEFLSMKLATVNPRSDLNMEALLSKEILQSQGALKNALYQLDSAASLPFEYQPQQLPPLHSNNIPNEIETHFPVNLNAALTQNSTMPSPAYGRFGGANPQASQFFEDDLQSMIHMGFGQIEQHSLHGSSVASAQMKVEY